MTGTQGSRVGLSDRTTQERDVIQQILIAPRTPDKQQAWRPLKKRLSWLMVMAVTGQWLFHRLTSPDQARRLSLLVLTRLAIILIIFLLGPPFHNCCLLLTMPGLTIGTESLNVVFNNMSCRVIRRYSLQGVCSDFLTIRHKPLSWMCMMIAICRRLNPCGAWNWRPSRTVLWLQANRVYHPSTDHFQSPQRFAEGMCSEDNFPLCF